MGHFLRNLAILPGRYVDQVDVSAEDTFPEAFDAEVPHSTTSDDCIDIIVSLSHSRNRAGRKRSPAKKNAGWACAPLPCPMIG